MRAPGVFQSDVLSIVGQDSDEVSSFRQHFSIVHTRVRGSNGSSDTK
jgi:hypothetical protein